MSQGYDPRSFPQPIQQVYVQYAPKPATNGLAIAALVLGIVAAALSLIPLVGLFVCWLPALLGIIFGLIGLGTARRNNGIRRTEALWGLICALLPIPIVIVGFAIAASIASSTQR